jgi:hypothetical protein
VGVGPDSLWVVGANGTGGAHAISRWTGDAWEPGLGAGVAICVGPDDVPWTIDAQGNLQAGG